MSVTVWDFVGFTFNKKHSIRDLKIYRTSDGDRFNEKIHPNLKEKIESIPQFNEQTLLDQSFQSLEININFAFDRLLEKDIRVLKQTFHPNITGELIFDELPFKAYDVKLKNSLTLKYVCFDENIRLDSGLTSVERVYKGEGTLNFIAYYPFAHTVPYCWTKNTDGTIEIINKPTKWLAHICSETETGDYYDNYLEWKDISGTDEAVPTAMNTFKNKGEVPSFAKVTFKINATGECIVNLMEKDVENTITAKKVTTITLPCSGDYEWDTRTGIIKFIDSNSNKILTDYKGNSIFWLQPQKQAYLEPFDENIAINNQTWDYEYWYY